MFKGIGSQHFKLLSYQTESGHVLVLHIVIPLLTVVYNEDEFCKYFFSCDFNVTKRTIRYQMYWGGYEIAVFYKIMYYI